MSVLPFSTTTRVRFAETDAMGVVYHGRYLEYLEVARIRLLEAVGLPYPHLIALGCHLPVVQAQVSYLSPARFDDQLDICITAYQLRGVRLSIDYQVRRDSHLLVQATTTHACVAPSGRAIRPPAQLVAALAKAQG